MERKWTAQQQQVISLRDRNLLVSAAAGSGKTAVLVERIIQKISDASHPVDIDRLLIVTFTNAAASEMRERIGAALERLIEEQPEDLHLQRQQTLLHNAQITTIHSFCLSVIRNYFHRIDLDPDFRIAEEGELKLLKSDVLDRVLERYYQEARPEFLTLSETIATGKNDLPFQDAVLKLLGFAMSYPWPEEWLGRCKEPFAISGMEEFEALPLAAGLLSYLGSITRQWARQLQLCQEISQEADGPQMYAGLLSEEAETVRWISGSTSYQQYYDRLQGFSFGRLPAARKYTGDPGKKDRVQKLRNEVKASVKKVTEQFFFQEPGQMVSDMQKIKPVADMLVEVTLSFAQAFSEKKREKNILDFNDLEHFALKILMDGQTRQPTRTAAELRAGYEEIMIDEYQDSNYVQETILRAVSKETEGIYNIFMVGDVKQSIYRFRMARPELFMEKYRTYSKEESQRQRIDLHKNFRSRPQILEAVNQLFYRMMKADIGNITYDAEAALYHGASFPEGEPGMFEPKLLVIEPDDGSKDIKAPELEARAVGLEIQRMMQRQQVTGDMPKEGDPGSLRPVRYSDIVILLRSLSGWSETFVKVLGEMGIPAQAASGTGYFSAAEVQTALNLLRVLDNPRQDIPMAAALASPIAGLSGEDLARIRVAYPDKAFYQAVWEIAEEQEAGKRLPEIQQQKLRRFLELVGRYRKKISYTPIHELLYQVLEDTGYLAYVSALPGGERKRANLEMLIEKAIAYETTSYRGLFHFIRYMEQLQKYEVDFALAEAQETEDMVRIMSIHKSKGLEFPIVFVSGLGKTFNNQDIRERVVLHPSLGFGMDLVDLTRRLRTPGLTRQLLAREITMENVGEELRVLYVAMTRAKERLILTGIMKKAGEKLESMQAVTSEDGFLTFLSRLNANSFLQFLLLANTCLQEPYPITRIRQEEILAAGRQAAVQEGLTKLQLLASLQEPEVKWKKEVAKRLAYRYPFEEEVAMRTKVSVSELKQRAVERLLPEEQVEIIGVSGQKQTPQEAQPMPERERYIPAFMKEIREEATGARRGTAMHRVLECYDFTRPPETLDGQLLEMERQGKIGKEQMQLVYRPALERFLRSSLGERMQAAAKKNQLFREKPFVMGIEAKEILGGDSREMILVQGIVDVFFEEDGKLTLVDYKTDWVEDGKELVRRYQSQLQWYQEAVERAVGKEVIEKVIYSFRLGEAILLG